MKTKLSLFIAVLAVGLFGMGCASTEPAFVSDGLVAYYPFNGNAKDESGNGNDGELKGVDLTGDRHQKPNEAFEFTGKSRMTFEPSDIHKQSNITISFWMLLGGAQDRKIRNIGISSRRVSVVYAKTPNTQLWLLGRCRGDLVDGSCDSFTRSNK